MGGTMADNAMISDRFCSSARALNVDHRSTCALNIKISPD
jgi:hypothetical protein